MRSLRLAIIKIALVGYGSQGRRVAEAISGQGDFHLVGVCLNEPDLTARMAFKKGLHIYGNSKKSVNKLERARIAVHGLLTDLISQADVVVDATPSGIGQKNKQVYSKCDVKVIFQAGEQFDIADVPVFISALRYNEARKAQFVRIPSPNIVSLFRTILPIEARLSIRQVVSTFVMPGSEPMQGTKGPLNAILPDSNAFLEFLATEFGQVETKPVSLNSFIVPSTLLGVQSITLQLNGAISRSAVIDTLCNVPRTILLSADSGLNSTDAIFEYFRRVFRPSGDIYEVCVWQEQIRVNGGTVNLVQAFDPHCVQTPEIIDAARALAGKEEMQESFSRTDNGLGILRPGLYP